jgi:protein-S-isoprenylcysteine O-methyltransferase Ste14
MDSDLVFRVLTGLYIVGLFGISGYYRHRAHRQGGAMRSREGQHAVALVRLYALLIWLPLLAYLINPTWVAWARLPLPDVARWSGAGLALLTLPLAYWVFSSLGNNVSPTQATRTGHQLVTRGPYRFVRHPLYTTGVFGFAALALMSAMWWIVVAVVPALLFLMWRTPHEEARLVETFGEEYQAYARRTGRFVPKLF